MKTDSVRDNITWVEKLGADVLKFGAIPKHIAIVLDGNRRFARKKNLSKVVEGHVAGMQNLRKVVDLLLYLGVKELTVYIFSTENFKRSAEEVAGIMEILEKELEAIDEAHEKGIRFNFIGNLDLTPTPRLRKLIDNAMLATKNNNRLTLNYAFIYTGRSEITEGVNYLLKGLLEENLVIKEVNGKLLEEEFFIHTSPVDILIRTSGESRLSDFMTWSGSEAQLEFVQTTWPEFGFWDFSKIILKYQRKIKAEGHFEQSQD